MAVRATTTYAESDGPDVRDALSSSNVAVAFDARARVVRRGARNRCSPLKKTDYCVEKAERKYVVWRFSQAQFSRRLHFSQKKGIALVLHISYFFLGDGLKPKKPSRQGSSRGPRGLARVGHSTCEKAETFLAGVFGTRIQSAPREASKRTDRT